MKRVILKKTYCGASGLFTQGMEVELPDNEAAAFVKAGFAEAVKPPVQRGKKVDGGKKADK